MHHMMHGVHEEISSRERERERERVRKLQWHNIIIRSNINDTVSQYTKQYERRNKQRIHTYTHLPQIRVVSN